MFSWTGCFDTAFSAHHHNALCQQLQPVILYINAAQLATLTLRAENASNQPLDELSLIFSDLKVLAQVSILDVQPSV